MTGAYKYEWMKYRHASSWALVWFVPLNKDEGFSSNADLPESALGRTQLRPMNHQNQAPWPILTRRMPEIHLWLHRQEKPTVFFPSQIKREGESEEGVKKQEQNVPELR